MVNIITEVINVEYISKEAIDQIFHKIADGLSVGEKAVLERKDVKDLYKIKGAKEILDILYNDLCSIPSIDIECQNELEIENNQLKSQLQEAKKLLQLAIEDFESIIPYLSEPYSRCCEQWQYANEAKKLIGGINNDLG